MDENKLKELIMEKQSEQRISCHAACEIADKAGVPRQRVGRLIDDMDIKIHTCQLGCFK
jgi:hypothetical protein